jgi:DNA-binding HxlR family transcriptional regulator
MAGDDTSTVQHRSIGCPLDPILTFLALKWLAQIVWFLGLEQSLRFAELQRQLPGHVSAKVLSARLKQLESFGIVARSDKGTKPPHVTYQLTAYGRKIHEMLVALESHARSLALPDVSLLMTRQQPSSKSTI